MKTDVEDRVAIETAAPNGWAFVAATLLGAFLLFQVQPLIGKQILPWFGGAPAVWTTCMLFFQVVLFGGYAYSHLLASRLSPRGQVIVQCMLLAVALVSLPISARAAWKYSESPSPTFQILLLLTASVGLPYFVLSTTSPLIQSWFSRNFPRKSAYRLYAVSNVGSFVALLSYLFVFEPMFDLGTQSRLWSWAFVVYAMLFIWAAAAVWRAGQGRGELAFAPRKTTAFAERKPTDGVQIAPNWLDRAAWLLLPAGASLMLLATTNHVCQDVAVVPFLWVVPLSLYLLSFVLCFDRPGWYSRQFWAVMAIVGIAAVMGGDKMLDWLAERLKHEGKSLMFVHELVLHFGTLFAICMLCHGELVRRRPEPRRLTEFYLFLSAGGALGGVIVSLVAPRVVKTFLEWNLGMVAAYGLATVVLLRSVPKKGMWRTIGLLLAGFAFGGFFPLLAWQGDLRGSDESVARLVDRQRNFFGVVSVWELDRDDPKMHRFSMKHGAISHGQQYAVEDRHREPLGYFTHESGIGRTLLELQRQRPALHVGVVGLGVGSLAAYARSGDAFTFYEINPAVEAMAEKYFTYLGDARGRGARIDVVLGDGRLSLERAEPQKFDLLVLDAFAGDSVPVHLLTREALAVYRRHVAADDAIVIQATNSYLYLFPAARALAEDAGLAWRRVYTQKDDSKLRLRSDWVLLTNNAALLAAIPDIAPPEEWHDDFTVPVWTDQKSNLFRILIR